jgi:SPP1 gp7 family putative phage head morphogenesis protein
MTRGEKRLIDIAIKNQGILERLKSGLVKDYEKIFPEIEKAIGSTLAATKISTLDELSKKELDRTIAQLRAAQLDLYQKANGELIDQLSRTSRFTIGKEAQDLNRLRTDAKMAGLEWDIPKPAASWSFVNKTPIAATGELMGSFIERITEGNMARVENAVRNGWAQGKTIADVTRQIYGTKANAYKDGLTQMNRRGVQAMVRTSTQHTAMTSRMAFFDANDDFITGYKFIATLDTRTTSRCRSLDGKEFELGKGPLPPVHVNCRSTIIPKLGPEFDFLDEGATRSSEDGYVDANTTYYDWLKKQSPEDIQEVLGKTRSELFRRGGLTAEQFSKYNIGRNFEPQTLEQLYAKDPTPFRTAGVRPRGLSAADDELLFGPPRGPTASRIETANLPLGEAADISLPASDAKYDYFYHAVRYDSQLDSILENGILVPDDSRLNDVYLTNDITRYDRGSGFVQVRVPRGTAVETSDYFGGTELVPEWRVKSVPRGDVIRVVREYRSPSGFGIREDQLAANIRAGLLSSDELAEVRAIYPKWFGGDIPPAPVPAGKNFGTLADGGFANKSQLFKVKSEGSEFVVKIPRDDQSLANELGISEAARIAEMGDLVVQQKLGTATIGGVEREVLYSAFTESRVTSDFMERAEWIAKSPEKEKLKLAAFELLTNSGDRHLANYLYTENVLGLDYEQSFFRRHVTMSGNELVESIYMKPAGFQFAGSDVYVNDPTKKVDVAILRGMLSHKAEFASIAKRVGGEAAEKVVLERADAMERFLVDSDLTTKSLYRAFKDLTQ